MYMDMGLADIISYYTIKHASVLIQSVCLALVAVPSSCFSLFAVAECTPGSLVYVTACENKTLAI